MPNVFCFQKSLSVVPDGFFFLILFWLLKFMSPPPPHTHTIIIIVEMNEYERDVVKLLGFSKAINKSTSSPLTPPFLLPSICSTQEGKGFCDFSQKFS